MSALIPTPDIYTWPLISNIVSVTTIDGHVEVSWDSGEQSRFHAMWLRDQCACPECTHPITHEQRIDLLDIADDIAAVETSIEANGGLKVHWNQDDHESLYNPGWLYAHSGLAKVEEITPKLWDAVLLPEPPDFDGADAMRDDDTLYAVCEAVCRFGIARLRELPTTENTVEAFARRIGPIRETHFERIFDVISRPDADSNAYTSDELPSHTDLPTRETPHGLQLLHCLINDAAGGAAIMIDGFRIAEDMRRDYPEDFDVLAKQKWTHANRAGETDYRWNAPIFELNEDGSLDTVRMASFLRAPLMVDFEGVELSYRGLRRFLTLTHENRYRMTFTYRPGDLVIFDNRRVLHARGAFDPQSGDRHLQGTYVDRDDLYSTLRMIRHNRIERELDV